MWTTTLSSVKYQGNNEHEGTSQLNSNILLLKTYSETYAPFCIYTKILILKWLIAHYAMYLGVLEDYLRNLIEMNWTE